MNNPPAVGDKLLFVLCNKTGAPVIYLAEVKDIRPEGEFKEPSVLVRGLHMFFPDGSHQPYRARTEWAGSISEFTKPIGERLLEEIESLEKQTAQTRTWLASIN